MSPYKTYISHECISSKSDLVNYIMPKDLFRYMCMFKNGPIERNSIMICSCESEFLRESSIAILRIKIIIQNMKITPLP